jgi:hypothetical protein
VSDLSRRQKNYTQIAESVRTIKARLERYRFKRAVLDRRELLTSVNDWRLYSPIIAVQAASPFRGFMAYFQKV